MAWVGGFGRSPAPATKAGEETDSDAGAYVPVEFAEATARSLLTEARIEEAWVQDVWAAGQCLTMGAYIRFRSNELAVLAISAIKGVLRRSPRPPPHEGVYCTRSTPPSVRGRARLLGSAFAVLQAFDPQLLVESSGAVIHVARAERVATVEPDASLTILAGWHKAYAGQAEQDRVILQERVHQRASSAMPGDLPLGTLLYRRRRAAGAAGAR